MSRVVLKFWLFIFCVLLLGLPPGLALDEEVKSELEEKIPISDTITIISSRLPSFKTSLSEIPGNVTYKSREDLKRTQPHFFQQSMRDLEGAVLYDNTGNGLDANFSLRGFADSSAVIFLVDGVRVNEVDGDAMTYPLISMMNVDSIQVERGSHSPIYGSGAFGGVVNITTKKASPKLISTFGGVEWTSFSGIRFNEGVSGTIPDKISPLEGNATYYFNMGRDLGQGFRNNGEYRITSLDGKLGYELPDESGGVRVGIKHVDDAISNPGELTLNQFHGDAHATNKPLDGRDFKNTVIQMEAEKKFFDNRLTTSVLAYWRTNWIHFFSTFATFATAFPTQLTTVRSRATDLIWQAVYQDQWKWIGNKSEVGMEMRDASEHDLRQDVSGGNVVETSPRRTDRSARPVSTALFWRHTVELFERVSIYGGMRHDFAWARIKDNLNPLNNYSRRWRQSTLSTGTVFHPMTWWDLFGSYSQGFRVPAISEINSFNSDLNASIEPEKSDSYELGTRLRFKELAQVKSSWFLIDVEDEIVFDGTQATAANPFGRNVNAGTTRRYGIENRLDVTPVSEFLGYLSYTWMKGLVSEAPLGGTPFNDRELGQIPQNTFTMGGTLKPLKRLGSPYDGLQISFDSFFLGKQRTEAHESESQALINAAGAFVKPYTVWNLTVLFGWKEWNLYFKINNLFDEHYFSRARAASSSGGIYPAGSYLFVNPGAPREFVVGMNWEFGK